jgi:hypothetical protein
LSKREIYAWIDNGDEWFLQTDPGTVREHEAFLERRALRQEQKYSREVATSDSSVYFLLSQEMLAQLCECGIGKAAMLF